MEHGDGGGRGRRKALSKQPSRRVRRRGPFVTHGRDARQQYIKNEEMQQKMGHTIRERPNTPLHISEFDDSYMRDNSDEFVFRAPQNTHVFPRVDYSRSWKGTEEAREQDPYAQDKMIENDYRFWNVFHSNFYATAILSKPSKICKMQYIDFSELREKNEFEFDNAIRTCDRFEMTDLMSFRYDWNKEILAQFHATYFWNRETDELHWMTDGVHYRIDFVTFCRILGFGQHHRSYQYIHDWRRVEHHEVRFMWKDPSKADGRRTWLKSFYYIMNNLIRSTLNPKDGAATELNGYITNVLSRFPKGDKFNVPRFLWVELSYAMDDGRRGLPYAPYLMFMIERVTGTRFPKDGFHTAYNIKKTQGGAATTHHTSGGSSYAHEDAPESSRTGGRRKKTFNKLEEWVKAIFTTCTYVARIAYEDQLESREAIRGAREMAGLPPLPPPRSPPQFPNLPRLSVASSDDDENL